MAIEIDDRQEEQPNAFKNTLRRRLEALESKDMLTIQDVADMKRIRAELAE